MLTSGKVKLQGLELTAYCWHNRYDYEICLAKDNVIVSSYKTDGDNEYMFIDTKARQVAAVIKKAFNKKVAAKKISTAPFKLGIMEEYPVSIAGGIECVIGRFGGNIVGFNAYGKDIEIDMIFASNKNLIPSNINYVKLTKVEAFNDAETGKKIIPVRSLAEIALDKDVSWLKDKKYYIVQDEEVAEKIFKFLENYDGPIAYDTETTGLRMNCFSKYGSTYISDLAAYNNDIDEQYRSKVISGEMSEEELEAKKVYSDKLTGIIFCWKPNESYYFPCGNRMFDNLYENRNKATVQNLINSLRAKKKLDDPQCELESTQYMNSTSDAELTCDFILMDRCRDILQNKHLVAHNGSFEWKVGYIYDIVTNIKDDTMILHQIMYKFKDTSRNSGENSNLKHLVHKEFGVDQLELSDFFAGYSDEGPEIKGSKRKKKKGYKVDFSYMDFDGSRAYAPADGDFTLQLFFKYKKDLVENYKELEYIYNVEVITSCAIAYMEFYGHRIDESKINGAKDETAAKCAELEKQIRELAGLAPNEELNIASPAQMAKLFFERLEIPFNNRDEKPSVSKKVLKQYLKLKDADGNPQYPIINAYSEWKKMDTLMTKFFDNLPNFMYPGGFIFSSYRQIETGTGRMSCNGPNAQQYPKVVTAMVSPRKNCVFFDADYSQIEYRVLTALAKEKNLMDMFKNPDTDYHTLMASRMYGVDYSLVTAQMRSDAKSFNFGIPYGMGFGSLAILLRGANTPEFREEAMEKYELYFKDQPNVRQFFDDVKEAATVNKYTRTQFNRRRYYRFTDKDGNYNNAIKARALRQAGNAVIQGCLDGNVRVQTKEFGIVKLKDVADSTLHVWDGDKWSRGDILYSGKKRKCIVKFSTGQSIVCSPIHKFLVRSAKGNDRFVECQDLRGSNVSTNPHRVVTNQKYVPSDFKYSSDWAHQYKSKSHNANNVFLEDIGDSFKIGVVLGRLASDGSIFDREVGASSIRQLVAEHELNIVPTLMEYMEKLNCTYKDNDVRDGRNQKVNWIQVYSQSLVDEVKRLDVKNCVHTNIFMDTELLRGFLRGMFDGDGGVSGKCINLVFGMQNDFRLMCHDIQKALLFFGIRCRYREYDDRHVLVIKTTDNKKFLEMIGFINEKKQEKANNLECVRDEHIFGKCLVVESVEITDEYIDMYDVCNTDGGYYVADGIITHNTAADIFKIAMARVYTYLRKNRLFGKVMITNMVHDEGLYEIDVTKVNPKVVMRDIVNCMQFKIDGYPPLFVGGGFGMSWKDAKGKNAEIHPVLSAEIAKSVDGKPIRTDYAYSQAEVIEEFDKLNYEFRLKKIKDYLCDENNFHKALHPVIGNLLNTFFSFGIPEDEEDRTMKILAKFIEEYKLPISVEMYSVTEAEVEVEEDVEYEDEDEETEETEGGEIGYSEFALLDESDKAYGVNLVDLIDNFGYMVSMNMGVCGIDIRGIRSYELDKISVYLEEHAASSDDDPSECLEVVLLTNNNILNRTGYYVKGISGSNIAKIIKAKSKKLPVSQGTIEERLQG